VAGPPARGHRQGGVGKTTVAASLALALAAGGHRTLLVEVEGRQGIAQIFERDPLPYAERLVATTPGGGEVRALAVTPRKRCWNTSPSSTGSGRRAGAAQGRRRRLRHHHRPRPA